jgi:hypothetical protein
MTPTEVLKMLKSKIDAAGLNKCNYAIETGDIEAINQALRIHDVVKSFYCHQQSPMKTNIREETEWFEKHGGAEFLKLD